MAELIIPGFNPVIPGFIYTGEQAKDKIECLMLTKSVNPDQQMILDAMKIAAASIPKNAVPTGETFEDSYNSQRFLGEVLTRFHPDFRYRLIAGNEKIERDLRSIMNDVKISPIEPNLPGLCSFCGFIPKSDFEMARKRKFNHAAFYKARIINSSGLLLTHNISAGTLPDKSMTFALMFNSENNKGVENNPKVPTLIDAIYSAFSNSSNLNLIRDETRELTDLVAFNILEAYHQMPKAYHLHHPKSKRTSSDDDRPDEISFAA